MDWWQLCRELFPLCRSLAGPGYTASLARLSEVVPFELYRFASGTVINGWTVPPEWHPRSATLHDPHGRLVSDFRRSNLEVWSYSTAVDDLIEARDLDCAHLASLPDRPRAVPYRTTYYERTWGFSMTDQARRALPTSGAYRAVIDADLVPGHLVVGEAVLPGDSEREILLSTYLCHPSMANNELSGPLVLAMAWHRLAQRRHRRMTVRAVVLPETIGSICYLSLRGEHLRRFCDAGLVLTCLGDANTFHYKASFTGHTRGDRAMRALLRAVPDWHRPFDPTRGSDERNYNAPGWRLPVGVLMRSVPGEFAEYHTSDDDLSFISMAHLEEAANTVVEWVDLVERTDSYQRAHPFGAPRLTADLYPTGGTREAQPASVEALLWAANLSDGQHDVLAMVERSGCSAPAILSALEALDSHGHLAKELLCTPR